MADGFDFLGDVASGVGSYFGAKETNKANQEIARQNLAAQKEFAQSGIQWKVADAIKAGIHPLAALGANTTSFSPSTVGAADMSDSFGKMGQGVGRALKAAATREDRASHDAAEAAKLDNENKSLQNDILRTKLASDRAVTSRGRSGMLGPAMPSAAGRVPLPRPGPDRTITQGAAVKDDDIKQKEEDYPQTKIGRPFGYPVLHNPYFGDGQSFEDRYGESELASTAKFAVNTLADHVYTGWHWGAKPALRRVKRFYEKYGPRYMEGR